MENLPIRRATIDELAAKRAQALGMFADAFDTLERARALAAEAAGSRGGDAAHLSDEARQALAPGYGGAHVAERRARFVDAVRRKVDCAVWMHLLYATDLERVMDKQARDEFRGQLEKDPPEPTPETALATLANLAGQSGFLFRRGLANAFSALDRRFRSHDGFKIGARVVLSYAVTDYGSWNTYRSRDADIRDIERAFHVLDGKAQPERYAGILGAYETARPVGLVRAQVECESDYFRLKVFKNGNAHLWFKRDDLVQKVNRMLAEYYGETLGAGADASEPDFAPSSVPAKNLGWFPTPPAVAETVIGHASLEYVRRAGEPVPPLRILEPSAGTGNLARAALEATRGSYRPDLTCVEIHAGRAADLKAAGLGRVVQGDFLAMTPAELGTFDRIIMNPPFDRGLDVDHVRHAMRFLAPGGVLVAVMSAGVEFREDAKTVAFRAAVDRMATVDRWGGRRWHDLPAGSFADVGTMVNTVLLSVRAPSA